MLYDCLLHAAILSDANKMTRHELMQLANAGCFMGVAAMMGVGFKKVV